MAIFPLFTPGQRQFDEEKLDQVIKRLQQLEYWAQKASRVPLSVNAQGLVVTNTPVAAPGEATEDILQGDCDGPMQDVTVIGFQTYPIAAPQVGDDGKVYVWDEAGEEFVLATVGGGTSAMQYWRRNTIQNAAVGSYTSMKGLDDLETGITMAFAGSIVGISVNLENDVGGIGDNYDVQAYIDTGGGFNSTGLIATITGGGGTEISAFTTNAGIGFDAGDRLTIYDRRTAGVANVGSKAALFVTMS